MMIRVSLFEWREPTNSVNETRTRPDMLLGTGTLLQYTTGRVEYMYSASLYSFRLAVVGLVVHGRY